MIAAHLFADGARRAIDAATISDEVGRDGTLLWVDLTDPTDDELDCVQHEFSLHSLALEDARKHGQRPKLERYPDHVFLVAYGAELAEVDMFCGPSWLVTVRARGGDDRPWDPTEAVARFEKSGPLETTPGYLLYTILDDLVDNYFVHAERVEDELEALEEQIFSETPPDEREVQRALYGLRRDLLAFRRKVVPMREVVAEILRREVDWIDDIALTHFQDVYDHLLRAVDQLDSQRELMGNAVDAHLAIISNRMNEVMKKMTSWGAILLGSALIAGIYGMNFKDMPELGWRYGYPSALGAMALLTAVLYWFFKRRDWL
ncbi:MAG TPA: magnesium/cobalt transporter CorA [Acidimicrobiales bacterium]|nr:magnesium/cobalt transporter CorA [Acidimicrobiales bacterium]